MTVDQEHAGERTPDTGDGSLQRPVAAFRAGIKKVSPALPGLVPYGVILGIASLEIGLSDIQTVVMSVTVFAGAAQLAAIRVIDLGASAWVAIVAALTVNLRLLMYSASIAPYLTRLSEYRRWLLSYLLVDQVYALSIIAYEEETAVNRTWYYLGTALPSWVCWQSGVVIGVVVGDALPTGLQLEFAVPLLFLALLVPTIESRATAVAAFVGATTAVIGSALPFQLGLILGVIAGVLVGRTVERRGL